MTTPISGKKEVGSQPNHPSSTNSGKRDIDLKNDPVFANILGDGDDKTKDDSTATAEESPDQKNIREQIQNNNTPEPAKNQDKPDKNAKKEKPEKPAEKKTESKPQEANADLKFRLKLESIEKFIQSQQIFRGTKTFRPKPELRPISNVILGECKSLLDYQPDYTCIIHLAMDTLRLVHSMSPEIQKELDAFYDEFNQMNITVKEKDQSMVNKYLEIFAKHVK